MLSGSLTWTHDECKLPGVLLSCHLFLPMAKASPAKGSVSGYVPLTKEGHGFTTDVKRKQNMRDCIFSWKILPSVLNLVGK